MHHLDGEERKEEEDQDAQPRSLPSLVYSVFGDLDLCRKRMVDFYFGTHVKSRPCPQNKLTLSVVVG